MDRNAVLNRSQREPPGAAITYTVASDFQTTIQRQFPTSQASSQVVLIVRDEN
jgi:hypothetical protein